MKESPITPFDQLIYRESIQILKLLFPYIPKEHQKILALYIRTIELQDTLLLFQKSTKKVNILHTQKAPSSSEFLQLMKEYIPDDSYSSLSSMVQMMEMMETLSQMDSDVFQNISPDLFKNFNSDSFQNFNPDSFQNFHSEQDFIFDSEQITNPNGGDQYGTLDESSKLQEDGSKETETDSICSQSDQREIRE